MATLTTFFQLEVVTKIQITAHVPFMVEDVEPETAQSGRDLLARRKRVRGSLYTGARRIAIFNVQLFPSICSIKKGKT